MTYDELIAHYGSQQAVANALKVGQTTVVYWKKVGIPTDHQIAAEVETGGKLRADLPPQVRNPEVRPA